MVVCFGMSLPSSYFGIGTEEVVECGVGDEGCLQHMFLYEVGYLQEGNFSINKPLYGHFVGGIHDAGHITALGNGIIC